MMMKVSLLLLLGAACMVSALTCPRIYECSAIGGSCLSDTTTVRRCNAGLSTNSTGSTCTCYQYVAPTTTPAPTYTLGATCDQSLTWSNHVCTTDLINGITETRWFSNKRIGDVCSPSDFDCYPPRKCVSGKCQGNLAIGATCYNSSVSTAADAMGVCVHNAYCERNSQTTGASQSVATCVARRASGESCYLYSSGSRSMCAAGLECVSNYARDGMSWCGRTMLYYLDGGAAANSSSQCKSGLLNVTDGSRTCLSYDYLNTLVNTKKGLECDTIADCVNSADTLTTLSRCACDGMGTSNTARCSAYRPSTPTQLAATYAGEVQEQLNLYNAGCETRNEHFSYPSGSDTSNYCYRFEQSIDDDTNGCPLALAQVAAGAKDCSGEVAQYCGALHTLRTSVAVLLALMLATILGSN